MKAAREALDAWHPAEIDAILSALDAAGLCTVPKEPTEAMLDAYNTISCEENGAWASLNRFAYAAMLAAAQSDSQP